MTKCDGCGRPHRDFQIWGAAFLCPACHRRACDEIAGQREWDEYGTDPEPWVFVEEQSRVPA